MMTYNLGGDFPLTAYVRIKRLVIDFNPALAVLLGATKYVGRPILEVKSGRNKNLLDTWTNESWVFGYDHTINKDAISQAYQYLKTLPEFVGVTDVTD